MAHCHTHGQPLLYYCVCIIIFLICISATAKPEWHITRFSCPASGNWLNHGGDIYNRRYACGENKISPSTVSKLKLKWEFYAGKDISATPAILKGVVYFPSWNGYLYAVNASDGSLLWERNLQKLTGLNATVRTGNVTAIVSRSTPSIVGETLIIGIYGPAVVIGVKRATGDLLWMTLLDRHPAGLITMSGTYYNGAFYVGTSSLEEGSSKAHCCTFRGRFAKLDVWTGKVLWQTFMLPDNKGKRGEYAGAAIWGSSPSIDAHRGHVYIATGNLYSAPKHVLKCQEKQNNKTTTPTTSDKCVEPENHSDSILALDLDTGKIKWFRQLGGYDVFFIACINSSSTPNCPPGPNPDADFGEAPMMLSVVVNGSTRDIVVAVQKSGFAWALDRDNGEMVWYTEAGPGGFVGGGTWGAATDNERVYTSIANSNRLNFTLLPSKNVTIGGGWVAMDAQTGKILWSTAVPDTGLSNPVTVANGVLFAGSVHPRGPVFAINAKTGEILWSYYTGATVYGGMSVSNGCVYVGNGYRVSIGAGIPIFTGGTSLFAFCLE
ncbi:PREDICTED: uncharacterized protein LOC109158176 [Ipomoea nil]|uniref:uncharacterized protein LOC109158176 n=1 Tax=Ipomoea nil TaxID=35883 RepID=UPI000900B100|nr:PREDICTED: uncharacterized protein LOC109158176 [Ipomoea nil]